ncbi:type VII secretion-associated serine protease mycosin [Peterkaempfera bronchialis]|uniref:type VII secretion-associated serine protease mycosin n=1 Tax=Peterkaempfera bronchialis TaxID=2126346 RepID=UPI003C2C0AE7
MLLSSRGSRRWVAEVLTVGSLLLGSGLAVVPASAADSIRSNQWYLDAMQAPNMWKSSTGKGVTVAVIDTGVNANHPDLVGQVEDGKNFSDLSGGSTVDAKGHGTGIAAMIAGTGKGLGGKGGYGLAPEAKILSVRVGAVSDNEAEHAPEFLGQLSKAIRYAADSDARILNMSVGSGESDAELQKAVDYAMSKGKLLVAAVGNNGDSGNPVIYPAALPGVVGVSAVDQKTQVTGESEHGPQVALAAPGTDMFHACTGPSGYCKSHGTSDATALVSASAALVWAKHPEWTANQVLRVLINTASKPADGAERSDYLGYGVVRPRVALSEPGDPGPADVNPLLAAGGSAAPSASAGGGPSGAVSQAPGSGAGSEGGGGSAAPVPVPAAKADDGGGSGSGVGLWIGVGAGVLVVAAVVVIVLVRRGRGGGDQPPSGGGPYGGGNPYAQPYPPQQYPPQQYQVPPSGSFGPPPGGPYGGGGGTPPRQ